MKTHCILVLGAAGRVGLQIAYELLRHGHKVVMVDIVSQSQFEQRAKRLLNDALLAAAASTAQVAVYGEVDALDKSTLLHILATEAPDLVVNYAIPITWDATKRLPNYAKISAAGLGAFTPIQVVTPLVVAQAIAESGCGAAYMVGNLPDITVPIITGIARGGGVAQPVCGAGNVGLNQIALRRQLAIEHHIPIQDVEVSLVSHHVHWVAPREPGYSNSAPFLARIKLAGEDVTDSIDDLRSLMNRGVQQCYESDASFSSTTGILASRLALAVLDESGASYHLHAPAPSGLPGGYPVLVKEGAIATNLPAGWVLGDAVAAMEHCHTLDGVQAIDADGTVHFTDIAQQVLKAETGLELPATMAPGDIDAVAREQIAALKRLFATRA